MLKGELYELIGFGWRFPIVVEWINSTQAAVVLADIPILKKQRATVEKTLHANKEHHADGLWYFNRTTLEKIAQRSNRTDPEDVVVWERNETDVEVEADFVMAYCKWRESIPAIRNTQHFAIIWDSIRRFMVEWILVRRQPLELGFATVHAFPARANWKAAITGRYVAQLHNNLAKDSEKVRREVRKMLHQSWITAWNDQSRTFCWSLDIQPTKVFTDAVEFHEGRAKVGKGSYAWQMLQLLKMFTIKRRMYDSLMDFIKEAQRPFAKLPHGFVPRGDDEGPQPEIVPQSITDWMQTPLVIGQSAEDAKASAVVPADESVPPVPPVQSDDEDVRDYGIDVVSRGKG
jgi:hypothetical protein